MSSRAQGKSMDETADLKKQVEELREAIAALNTQSVVPMSYQPTPKASVHDDPSEAFTNKFDIPKSLRNEIKKKGYNYKFINFSKFKRDSVHKSHWIPYKPEQKTVQDMTFGVDPDGYVVRGDCVLAVRSNQVDKLVKNHIKERNHRLQNYNSSAKKELEDFAKDSGIPMRITEGYEED